MTRQIDRHLDDSELDALVFLAQDSAKSTYVDSALIEARRHVESCEDCTRKVQLHGRAQSELTRLTEANVGQPGAQCPQSIDWIEVAAGLLPEIKTTELMQHAAQCENCGPLLKQAAETLSDDATPQEEQLLATLQTSQNDAQRSLAEKLRGAQREEFRGQNARTIRTSDTRPNWWTGLAFWQRSAFAGVAFAAIVMAAWLGRSAFQKPSAEQLLAQAYTEHRTLEVRIAGAKFAPMRVERGGSGTSSLDKPATLLQAEALIGENLKKHPNDPVWLQAKARADLLDGNYESAIQTLQRALESQTETESGTGMSAPLADKTSLLTDLASAYFQRAESADRPIDYGNAIEALGKALAKSPDDPVALFNRALACERMFLYTQAVDDWQHYLRVDPTGPWADDARTRLAALQDKLKKHAEKLAEPLLTPEEIARAGPDNTAVREKIDARIEDYLNVAVTEWLPKAYASASASPQLEEQRRALEVLSAILKDRHGDKWLGDFLRSQNSPSQSEAIRSLITSDEAVHGGRYSRGIDLARQSISAFHRSGNQAGVLRASFALMYAQSFALKHSDCLQTAAAIAPVLESSGYSWLRAQTLIERGQCAGAMHHLQEAVRDNNNGLDLAGRSHYVGLILRAISFAAGSCLYTANFDGGLRQLSKGLATFWRTPLANVRGENLYTFLSEIAEANSWFHTNALALAEILKDFPTKDPVDQAVRHQLLADALENAGEYSAARDALRTVTLSLNSLPEDRSVDLRKAEIAVQDARIQLLRRNPQAVVASLSVLREHFDKIDSEEFQAQYFKIYGEALLALGFDSDAKPLLDRALANTESYLTDLRAETERLAWSRLEGQIYRDLVAIELKSGTLAEALALWEWYKGASLRSRGTSNSHSSPALGSSITTPPLSSYNLPEGTALVSYVFLENSATAFVLYEGNVRVHRLELPSDLEALALRFLRDCSTPSAELRALDAESRRLYDLLIAPLKSDFLGATNLWIETDALLDQIPFDLLRGADGPYLADSFRLSFSPGLPYLAVRGRVQKPEALSPNDSALILAVTEGQDPSQPYLADAEQEGKEVASYFHGARLLSGNSVPHSDVLQSLSYARVFHFAGHAIAGARKVGLIIGPGSLVRPSDLTAQRLRKLHLAVLSACDTANGSNGTSSDVNSVARVLTSAGVPQVVAGRWRVDSAVTRQLMRCFYLNLFSGKTAAESLRAAATTIRGTPGYQHPYYWGAFALFGNS